MSENTSQAILYPRNGDIAAVNKVKNFDPMRFVHRAVSPRTGKEVWKLELPVMRVWFRLALPQGVTRLVVRQLTEKMAIIEAQVYFDRSDNKPISNSVVMRSVEDTPNGKYLEAAQKEALSEALTAAGFGIQAASPDGDGVLYGSEVPITAQPVVAAVPRTVESTAPVSPPAEQMKAAEPVTAAQNTAPAAPELQPAVRTVEPQKPISAPAPAGVGLVQKAVSAQAVPEPVVAAAQQSVQETQPLQAAQAEPAVEMAAVEQVTEQPTYTEDMTVDEIRQRMTVQQAREIKVETGVCAGKTLGEVADNRAPSLKWYAAGPATKSNVLRAGALILLDELKKAG